jgi:putative hydrolase of the HAD superfamily
MNKIKAIIFDWGDTVMRDFPEYSGPMAYWPRVEAVKDIDVVLKHLHIDIICCLASNSADSNAELMGTALSQVNLRQYFRYLFTSRELGCKKPDSAFYREILRRLALKPEQCIAVGNDYEKDIVPAKKLGMTTVWFSPDTPSALASCADYTIDSVDKLVPVIKKLKNKMNKG